MARAPMVTRELQGTKAKVLTVDTAKQATDEAVLTIQGKYKTEDGLLKALKKIYETDTFKLVKVVESSEVHELYGMPSAEFYKNAIRLNPETRKPLAE